MTPREKSKKKREPAKENGKQKPLTFGAYPDQIERWTRAAKALDRPVGWYIRMRLDTLDRMDDERAGSKEALEKAS